jgi:DNA polymerase IV
MINKVILHIDMDAFFAAVEQRDDPSLRGKPVVVGADPKGGRGRGVVSTCSYEARVFGIHSAMPISQAYRLCPKAVFLPPDFRKYKKASGQMFEILARYTPEIEPISIDEAFCDITGSYHFHKTPVATARKIKDDIRRETGLAASIGLAPVKMVAKIASDFSKPDGLLEVKPGEVHAFLAPLPVERLWGVGKKAKAQLNHQGIYTIGDLAAVPRMDVARRLGDYGLHLHDLANGIDERSVSVDEEVKSVSHEHTFDVDESSSEVILKVLHVLSQKVSRRLRKEDLKGKTVTIKVRLEDFQTFTRARTLDLRTNFADTIYTNAQSLFMSFFKKGMKIRLIGVRVSHFDEAYVTETLFVDPKDQKKEGIHAALDKLKDRFGEGTIHWGA